MNYIGVDIGGTKCAVSLGEVLSGFDDHINIIEKRRIDTIQGKPYVMLVEILKLINSLLKDNGLEYKDIATIGISCGGPLDSKNGIVLSPPNLPEWDKVQICKFFKDNTGINSYLQNDANACAIAEWQYGAGRGYSNMVFITFGTGFGAGLIINGQLYSGFHDNAGEIGHVRLTPDGPEGYYKHGSVEGWCSGGGIAKIGCDIVKKSVENGENPLLWQKCGGDYGNITAKLIAECAIDEKDPMSIEIYRVCGEKLGYTISMINDIIDPEIIVIGGVYMRSAELLNDAMYDVIKREALTECNVVPAGLGEHVGDYAALSIAVLNDNNNGTVEGGSTTEDE